MAWGDVLVTLQDDELYVKDDRMSSETVVGGRTDAVATPPRSINDIVQCRFLARQRVCVRHV